MIPDDPLAEFYAATPRESSGLSDRSGAYGDVDAALNELEVPATLDDDGDWTLETDVGQIALLIDDITGDLVVVQSLMEAEDSPDFMHALLRLNFETRGLASFGAITQGGKNIFVITGRVAADDVSRETVQRLLVDGMRLSRRLDELLGTAPGQTADAEPPPEAEPPPAEPPAEESPPPEGEPVTAPAAETVFSQPVPEGAPPEAAPAAAEAAANVPEPAATAPDPPPEYPPPVVTPEYPPPSYPPPQPDLPPANWYPDPYAQARLRYWDGQQWTEHVAN
jgi:hypothetical protein